MATTDSNGILQLEVSDPVVPLQTALNGIGASVSSAMDSTVRTFMVANATARNNLATQRTPSKSNPLRVWRQDTGVAEINDGTGWASEIPVTEQPAKPLFYTVPGVTIANGAAATLTVPIGSTLASGKTLADYQPMITLQGVRGHVDRCYAAVETYSGTTMTIVVKKIVNGTLTAANWRIYVTLIPKW